MPNNLRGLGIAILGLTNVIFGAAAAPLLIAMVIERPFRDPDTVGMAITTVSLPEVLLGFTLMVIALFALRRWLSHPTSLREVMMPEYGK